ncbi:M14 family zinc carboxypeptidase [Pedobacter duraquae]|uniref:Zinc carboxypeptidase n=1 Tax=Pedobacter duraquae TaxID=425511 RepID=A0A4R6IFY8_9SPHI|nr:M14 family zinc carboxypeptidase [Pedobacter duraquae]TDO21042.1 zinc carboxypeptidase [Pedobacter duraquae]
MDTAEIIARYDSFADKQIRDRFIKPRNIADRLSKLPAEFESGILGLSEEGLPIPIVKIGKGPVKIMLWSQMHGDEPTGTMALMDLINFLAGNSRLKDVLRSECTIYLVPMVNPDGAVRFTRRNAQQIDINRDYIQTSSKEATLLKNIRREIKPDFGFNLHDQDTLWSVGQTGNPASLSFLAPAFDAACSNNPNREQAMLVIADIFETLHPLLPNQIGLFDESYEPRAFGDNFQAEGTATILIEAGGLVNDPEKQNLRKYFFLSILRGLESIATRSFKNQQISNYRKIPPNSKTIFHIVIRQLLLGGIITSIALNYLEFTALDGLSTIKKYYIADIGDLSSCAAYATYSAEKYIVSGFIIFGEPANFDIFQDEDFILSFRGGILQSKQ